MIFSTILVFFAILYLFELAFYSYAAFRARREDRKKRELNSSPMVTVVVAARDEEKHLPACLDSLTSLNYPHDRLEVIIVNDQSADGTADLIDRTAQQFGFVERLDALENRDLQGKTNALSQGIDEAKGEFIFLTDADCVVPATWVTETLKYFGPEVGIVADVTLISKTEKIVHGIQALDWDILLSVGAGAATIGKPIACLGNNLVFRKQAYEDVGGYTRIKFSVTEDFALFKAIADSRKWRYRFPMERKALVETLPVESLKEVFSQRKRWATGGKETGLFGYLTLAPGFLLHWLTIASIFISFQLFVAVFILKLAIDSAFVFPTLKHYGKIGHLKFIVYFEIYYLVYVAILPFAVYFGKRVIWKGRDY
jgi:cellulose synthase/poly-beta-1,6-N-acetylglucosamine synthase-like glycosyltransferase